jgi:hypothetical protein
LNLKNSYWASESSILNRDSRWSRFGDENLSTPATKLKRRYYRRYECMDSIVQVYGVVYVPPF